MHYGARTQTEPLVQLHHNLEMQFTVHQSNTHGTDGSRSAPRMTAVAYIMYPISRWRWRSAPRRTPSGCWAVFPAGAEMIIPTCLDLEPFLQVETVKRDVEDPKPEP